MHGVLVHKYAVGLLLTLLPVLPLPLSKLSLLIMTVALLLLLSVYRSHAGVRHD